MLTRKGHKATVDARRMKISALQHTVMTRTLSILINCCLSSKGAVAGRESNGDGGDDALNVRSMLVSAGALELALQATDACITHFAFAARLAEAQVKRDEGSGKGKDIDLDDEALLAKLFSGLLSRLAGLPSVQQGLVQEAPYRILCRVSRKLYAAIEATPSSLSDLQGALAHLVTVLAHLPAAKLSTGARQAAQDEQLASTLLGAFPEPRRSLGSITEDTVTKAPERPMNPILVGNAALCLRALADDDIEGKRAFTEPSLIAVEKLICALATCTNSTVRKNIATVLAKACKHPGVKEKMTRLKGLQIMRELSSQGQI